LTLSRFLVCPLNGYEQTSQKETEKAPRPAIGQWRAGAKSISVSAKTGFDRPWSFLVVDWWQAMAVLLVGPAL